MPLGVRRRDPPAVAAKYGNPDNRADHRSYSGHEEAGAPKLPAKGGHGLIFGSSNKDDSDDDNVVCKGATKPAVRQASAATKDGHSVRTIRANEDNPDNDKSASAGTRKLAWLQVLATPAKLDGGVGGTSHKTKGGHGHKIASRGEDGLDGDNSAPVGAKKPTLLQTLAAATVRSEVSARRGDGSVGIYPDDGVAAAARSAPGAKGRMPNNGSEAALESMMGTEVVRRALAALRDNIYEEAERDDNNEKEQRGGVKGKMAPMIAPKFCPTLRTGVGSTAGARVYGSPAAEGGPAAAKCQNTAGGKISGVSLNLNGARRRTNPPCLATAKAATGAKGPDMIPLDEEDEFPNEGTLTMTSRPAKSGRPCPGRPPIFFFEAPSNEGRDFAVEGAPTTAPLKMDNDVAYVKDLTLNAVGARAQGHLPTTSSSATKSLPAFPPNVSPETCEKLEAPYRRVMSPTTGPTDCPTTGRSGRPHPGRPPNFLLRHLPTRQGILQSKGHPQWPPSRWTMKMRTSRT
jgi:hypothetical protein